MITLRFVDDIATVFPSTDLTSIDGSLRQVPNKPSPIACNLESNSNVTFSNRSQAAKDSISMFVTGPGMQIAASEEQPAKTLSSTVFN
jgi:hypothetical protein